MADSYVNELGVRTDGTVRWWLDGTLQGDYTDMVNYGPGPFVGWTWTQTWYGPDCGGPNNLGPGGTTCLPGIAPVNTKDWYWWMDHLRISTR